jgi:hypothetical protein
MAAGNVSKPARMLVAENQPRKAFDYLNCEIEEDARTPRNRKSCWPK